MKRTRRRPQPRTGAALLGLLALLLLCAPPASADDVPDTVQSAYDAATGLLAKGDGPSLEKALGLLETRKDEALGSIDFWTLYARVWAGLKKDAAGLWDGIVKERQAAAPKSTVFDLARARVAKDAKAKRKWIDAALTRDKSNVEARTALGIWHVNEGDEDEGAELLESILEDAPGCAPAAIGLANLSLTEGFASEALEVLDAALDETKDAGLFHLTALCYQRKAKEKDRSTMLGKALDAAAQALGLEPNNEHIATYNMLLEQTGDAATATKALKTHFAKTKHPMLAALLAKAAFKAGDYEAALLGLGAADPDELRTIKASLVSHARMGNAADVKRLAAKVVERDSAGRLFAARAALLLGDAAEVQKRVGSLADSESRMLRAQAHAWTGEPDAIKKLGEKAIRSGSREGEDYLTAWFTARLFKRLGAELGDALRAKLLKARFDAAKAIEPQGGDHQADLGNVKTTGWPRRAVTYFRSRCGSRFKLSGDWFGRSIEMDGDSSNMTVYRSVSGTAKCGEEEVGIEVRFNGKTSKSRGGNGLIELFRTDTTDKLSEFKPAETAFAEACAAWLDGNHDKAEAACAKALKIEPAFERVRVFRSLARALSPSGEKRADAKDATKSVERWRDDFELRRTVILLRAWAGHAGVAEEITALAKREASMNVRDLAGL